MYVGEERPKKVEEDRVKPFSDSVKTFFTNSSCLFTKEQLIHTFKASSLILSIRPHLFKLMKKRNSKHRL